MQDAASILNSFDILTNPRVVKGVTEGLTMNGLEDLKQKILCKLCERATYDKEVDEWSVELDSAMGIVAGVIDREIKRTEEDDQDNKTR